MWAIANAKTESAVCFARHPLVDIRIGDAYSRTPLHFAIVKGRTHMDDNNGSERTVGAVIDVLLEKAGNDPEIINARDFTGNTPLHYAAAHADRTTVEKLISAGADATIRNNQGERAIDLQEGSRSRATQVLSAVTSIYTLFERSNDIALDGRF